MYFSAAIPETARPALNRARIHHRRFARLARVVQTNSQDVTTTLEQLVIDGCIPIFTAVVVSGEESQLTVDILEQYKQCIRRTLRLDLVLPRLRGLDREIDLLAGSEVDGHSLERLERRQCRLQWRIPLEGPFLVGI